MPDQHIWKFRKVDILFVVGIGMMIYGAVTRQVEISLAGLGAVGTAIAQRVDKPT